MKWPIIGDIVNFVTGFFERRERIKEAETQAEIRRLDKAQDYEHQWEQTAESRSDKFLRRTSFLMFTAPFVVAIFAPERVADYFNQSIQAVPEWWRDTFIAITGSVWAISSLKNIVPSIVFKTRAAWRKAKDNDD